jgi:hypothetical protein
MISSLMEEDWDLYCEVMARILDGWESPIASTLAELIRVGASPDSRKAAFQELANASASFFGASDAIIAPTLIAHTVGAASAADRARKIALRIPDAQIVAVPGLPRVTAPVCDDNPVLTTMIADFVSAVAGASQADQPSPTPMVAVPELELNAMRAILRTDVVSHTALVDRYGDTHSRQLLREHDEIVRTHLARHGGTEVKVSPPGFDAVRVHGFPALRARSC